MFIDRSHAGRALVDRLGVRPGTVPVILAMPRGGVPVGYEIATALHAPLDVVVVRKIGAPHQPEYAIGAVTEDGEAFFDRAALRRLALTPADLGPQVVQAQREIHDRVARYRGGRPAIPLAGRHVIVVDDGLATGMSARAALRTVRSRNPGRLTFAAPVGAPDAARDLLDSGDVPEVVCLETPERFGAVGYWYADFTQVGDDEAMRLLRAASAQGRQNV